jgi:alpha-tubulin suppressor-like RCC1 family protein
MHRRPLLLALLAFLVPACSDPASSGSDREPTPQVASVTVTPSTATLSLGETSQLEAVVRDGTGSLLTRPVTWQSGAPAVVTVSSTGLVTALGVGQTTITATSGGQHGSSIIAVAAVVPDPVAHIEIDPPTGSIAPGTTLQLTATLRSAGGDVLTGRAVTWTSSAAAVASVSNNGLVTGLVPGGPVTITAASETVSGEAQIMVTAPAVRFGTLASGYYHSCAVSDGGVAWCWGRNDVGQLGLGSNGSGVAAPSRVNTSLQFKQIAAGWAFTCGLATDGAAWCWGDGDDGTLGQGSFTNSTAPIAVNGGHVFTTIQAGDNHVCGVANQQGFCWGGNNYGMLGNGSTNDASSPQPVSGSHAWQWIGTGALHSCGLTTTGAAWCWGYAEDGELGNGSLAEVEAHVPGEVAGGHTFVQLSVGDWHTCGRTADGSLWCWGWNGYGQLGDGTTVDAATPVKVSGSDSYVEVSASSWATCGRLASGAVKCWGGNEDGELGDGTTVNRSTPTPIVGGHLIASLSQGLGYHHCGIRTDGRTVCWGWNDYGQLGIGSYSSTSTPTLIPEFAGLRAAASTTRSAGVAPPTPRGQPFHHRRSP